MFPSLPSAQAVLHPRGCQTGDTDAGTLLRGFEPPRGGMCRNQGTVKGVWAGTKGRAPAPHQWGQHAPALVPRPCRGMSRALPSPCLHLCLVNWRGFAQALLFHAVRFGKRGSPGPASRIVFVLQIASATAHPSCKGQAPAESEAAGLQRAARPARGAGCCSPGTRAAGEPLPNPELCSSLQEVFDPQAILDLLQAERGSSSAFQEKQKAQSWSE